MIFNENQFLEFYDKNVAKIYRYIYFRVSSQELAQDLASEVFLKCWQKMSLNGEENISNPRAFFYQVARNLIADFYRQRDKTPLSLSEIADNSLNDKIAVKKDGPVEQVSAALETDLIKKALNKLNNDYQEIIIWRYLDELEIKEIAEIMDKKEGAVRTLLSRALAELREILERK